MKNAMAATSVAKLQIRKATIQSLSNFKVWNTVLKKILKIQNVQLQRFKQLM
jgi:hypothetical protein